MSDSYTRQINLAKKWAVAWNIKGKAGGWLYETDKDASIIQGWHSLYLALRWLRIITQDGEVKTEFYASPLAIRDAYKKAIAWQRSTNKFL